MSVYMSVMKQIIKPNLSYHIVHLLLASDKKKKTARLSKIRKQIVMTIQLNPEEYSMSHSYSEYSSMFLQ